MSVCVCVFCGKMLKKRKIGKSECEVSGVKNFPLPLVKQSLCFLFLRLLLSIIVVVVAAAEGGLKK